MRRGDQLVLVPLNVQKLLAFLALQGGPQHRSRVAGLLWIDSSEERAIANLRMALWRARRIDGHLVTTTGRYIEIGPGIRIDFTRMIEWARRLSASKPLDGDAVPDLFVDDLLPEWYDGLGAPRT